MKEQQDSVHLTEDLRGKRVTSELNLWTSQWRDERIRKARADLRERDAAWQCLKDKSTDYARSIKMARDVCAQVLALWESSPVDLPADGESDTPS